MIFNHQTRHRGHGGPMKRACSLGLAAACLLAGCAATTSLTLTPSPQPALCQRAPERINAVVLWTTQWRADQKDVIDRETAAGIGIARFFGESGCFAKVEIRRLASPAQAHEQAAAAASASMTDVVLVVVVRELGPILRLGSSAALVEGGTEVILDFTAYADSVGYPDAIVHGALAERRPRRRQGCSLTASGHRVCSRSEPATGAEVMSDPTIERSAHVTGDLR